MSEEQTNFKVTDRRLFNPDGTPRDVPPEERAPEPAPATPPKEQSDDVVDAVYTEAAPPAEQPRPGPLDEIPGADDPASFTNFIMSIASNAAASLGMIEHPVTGKREVDLEAGKHWIDILGMLQQKSRGNLQPKEQQIVESLLADLRMQYVSLTSATAPKARTFSSRDITGG